MPPTEPKRSSPLPLARPYAKPLRLVALPVGVCTTTGELPYDELEGMEQVIWVADTTTLLAARPPIITLAGGVKLTPLIVINAPPVIGAIGGEMPPITGCPAGGV